MQLLRLKQLHNAVFVRINKATMNMIRRVEPYITYGYCTQKTIKELVYKRGAGKLNRKRIMFQTNEVIE
jgi:large subunit ribosomal protein L7e